MALTIHCKCTCASCGTEINYTSDQAGNVVQCPKCREKSRLPEPERLGLLEHKGPPLPQSRRCEICGSQINFLETACPFCAAERNKRALRNWIILGASAVAVVVIIGAVIHQLNKPKPVVVVPSTPHIMIAAPVARMP
ncbi:MAG TPA: hypothetical protein VG754_04565, partial [Verrucomicrobiae bacterium]|nr:hypothetical protein [Verrucomicrobiae bacterium]